MKKKGIQLNPSNLETELTPTQIVQFLEDFRNSHVPEVSQKKLISLRVDENLLKIFKEKCENKNLSYQKQIRLLMSKWLLE